MNIGIFDSGLGGLVIAKEIFKTLPEYNYIYFGDTKNLPFGNKSQKQIYNLTVNALKFLFSLECKLVIIACNTSSAKALRKIQQKFLPKYFPDKKVLGVIVPTIESIPKNAKNVGIIATTSTCRSHAYKKEIFKLNSKIKVFEQAAPQLVPYIENNALDLAKSKLQNYLKPLVQKNIDTLILGCTHYPILKDVIKKTIPANIKIISQENIIPEKLKKYLSKHKELEILLSKSSNKKFLISKMSLEFKKIANILFGKSIVLHLKKVDS